MHAVVLACAAQAVYIVAYVLFKTATGRMGPIGGRHPLHAAGRLVRSPRWFAAVAVVLAGFALSALALVTLPVVATLPAYGLGLVLLLAVGMSGFGERPTSREWLAVLITVAAMITAALSVLPGHGESLPDALHRPGGAAAAAALPLWKAGLVFVPSLVLPVWMFCVRDRPVSGRHARPLTGIAYGLGAGVLLGATEVFGQGMAMMLAAGRRADVPASPHPYLFLLAGVLGLGLLSIGLQRCRLMIVVTVVTVTAKTHLLLSATLLYGEPWPRDAAPFLLRVAGVGLAVLALSAFPRHERRARPVRSRHAAAPPAPPQARPAGPPQAPWDVPASARHRALPAVPAAGPGAPPPAWPVPLGPDGRWEAQRAHPSQLG
ncbi:hypothetical protein [Actinomadura sp. GTD37]|uniref:hypothetical protein n=1 Tax=Actinomadura sp. GTD37 TaxID=1778030 RepID=UPI0035C0CC17